MYKQLPASTHSLSLQELSDLDNETLQIYGGELIKKYEDAKASGEVTKTIPSSDVEKLRETFENIKFK